MVKVPSIRKWCRRTFFNLNLTFSGLQKMIHDMVSLQRLISFS